MLSAMKIPDRNVLLAVGIALAAFSTGSAVSKLTDGRGDGLTGLGAVLGVVATVMCLKVVIGVLRKPPNA